MENIKITLLVTGLGMGLVFMMIILLWALMAILVQLLTEKQDKAVQTAQIIDAMTQKKIRAVAAAVAIALSHTGSPEPHEFPLPPTALVSAWQAVMRTEMLKKRGHKR